MVRKMCFYNGIVYKVSYFDWGLLRSNHTCYKIGLNGQTKSGLQIEYVTSSRSDLRTPDDPQKRIQGLYMNWIDNWLFELQIKLVL